MTDTGSPLRTWFHIHIPKTGGTSLRMMLSRNFREGYFSACSLLEHQKLRIVETRSILEKNFNWLRCYSDHRLSLEMPFETDRVDLRALAFVRQPFEQINSQFHFQKAKVERAAELGQLDLHEFVKIKYAKNDRWSDHLQWRRLTGVTRNRTFPEVSDLVASQNLIVLPLEQFELACVTLEKLFPDDFQELVIARENQGPESKCELEDRTRSLIEELAVPDFRLYQMAEKQLAELAAQAFADPEQQADAITRFQNRSAAVSAS